MDARSEKAMTGSAAEYADDADQGKIDRAAEGMNTKNIRISGQILMALQTFQRVNAIACICSARGSVGVPNTVAWPILRAGRGDLP
jgi:uncharacterized protein (UPF0262 family)